MSHVVFHYQISADKAQTHTGAEPQREEIITVDAYDSLNLLAHAQIAERSLQSRCGGQCACGTCRIQIVSGTVSPMSDEEKSLLQRVGGQNVHRLACQCFPELGEDVHVLVPTERFKDARFAQNADTQND